MTTIEEKMKETPNPTCYNCKPQFDAHFSSEKPRASQKGYINNQAPGPIVPHTCRTRFKTGVTNRALLPPTTHALRLPQPRNLDLAIRVWQAKRRAPA